MGAGELCWGGAVNKHTAEPQCVGDPGSKTGTRGALAANLPCRRQAKPLGSALKR